MLIILSHLLILLNVTLISSFLYIPYLSFVCMLALQNQKVNPDITAKKIETCIFSEGIDTECLYTSS